MTQALKWMYEKYQGIPTTVVIPDSADTYTFSDGSSLDWDGAKWLVRLVELGRKLDASKPRWSLFPALTLAQVLAVLEFGAVKYEVDNWKHVPDARKRYYDAMMRHIDAWWYGEFDDPDSGLHHLAHACCCALFLIWFDREVT